MKIAIVGNCQSCALKESLKVYLPSNCHLKSFTPVFAIEPSEVEELHKFIKDADILITQPIQDQYRNSIGVGTNTLGSLIPRNSPVIIVPNCHWEGYFPNYLYIKDRVGNTVTSRNYGSPSDYHDGFILSAYDLGLTAEDAAHLLSQRLPASDWAKEHLISSFKELQKREESCNIKISDYIEKHYRFRRLFYTFNHPKMCIIDELAHRIAQKVGWSASCYHFKKLPDYLQYSKKLVRQILSDPKIILQGKSIFKEYNIFSELIVPIYSCVSANIDLEINISQLNQAKFAKNENWLQIVKNYFDFYKKEPEIIEINRTVPRIRECQNIIKIFQDC